MSLQLASQLRKFMRHMRSQCYLPPGRGDIPAFTSANSRFSNPRGMQGRGDLVGSVTYQGGIPI